MAGKEKKPREYRGVRDEIRQEHMKTKNMTTKEKLQYFWYYYKVHTIVTVLAVIAVITFVHDVVSSKDYIFYGVMLNSATLPSDEIEAAFAEYAGLDVENYDCFIDTSASFSLQGGSQYDMATLQKLMAVIQTGDLDAVVFDSEIFNNYSYSEMFADLRTVFTAEELEKYKDYLYYIDYADVLAAQENPLPEDTDSWPAAPSQEDAARAVMEETESHRHPENMEDPVPVGIYMEDSPFVKQSGAYPQSVPILGIISSSQRVDTGKRYLEFLWDETIDFTQFANAEADLFLKEIDPD